MKKKVLAALSAMACQSIMAQEIPTVYDVENKGAKYEAPVMRTICDLEEIRTLTNPLEWSDGSGIVTKFADWSRRRNEIKSEIEHYEIGRKPIVDKKDVKARMDGDTLYVEISVGDKSLTISTVIEYPETGEAPYALMIGTSHISLPNEIFDGRPIAKMTYNERQVNGYGQWKGDLDKQNYGFVKLYPELIDNGAYSEWAWGLSRLIDGLEILGPEVTKIDTKHIGLTGCSYAGKMALFCGAMDERVALTIAQEPGGGGCASWRLSHTLEGVEDLDKTDYHWFMESLRETFHGDSVYYLPYDHHELCAMVCPRALLILGNTDYKWLADESAYVSINGAMKVWEKFGIEERVGYSIVGGHPHCQLPEEQYDEVERFIDKFMLGKKNVDTKTVRKAKMFEDVDLGKWIKY